MSQQMKVDSRSTRSMSLCGLCQFGVWSVTLTPRNKRQKNTHCLAFTSPCRYKQTRIKTVGEERYEEEEEVGRKEGGAVTRSDGDAVRNIDGNV